MVSGVAPGKGYPAPATPFGRGCSRLAVGQVRGLKARRVGWSADFPPAWTAVI